jgi:hypothetical protein
MLPMLLLVIGAALGLVLLWIAMGRIVLWSRGWRTLVPLCFTVFGFLPAIVLRLGLFETTGPLVLFAIGYFVVFGVVATVALNGKVSRAEANGVRDRR